MNEWDEAALGDLLALDINAVQVNPAHSYDIVGVLNRGRGLLYREPIAGSATAYKTLNRIGPNQVVYSRLKAFEGAITVAPAGLHEVYASQEFPTFTCGPSLLPDYFRLLTTTKRLWETLKNLSTGMGGRRERVKPGDFLTVKIALPPLAEQRRIADLFHTIDTQIAALTEEKTWCDRLWWALGSEMIETLSGRAAVRLDTIAAISGGLTKNKKDLEASNLVEVPYLRVANVHRRYLDLSEVATIKTTQAKAEALRLLPGDVLFNEGGDRDKLGRGDIWRGQIDHCIHQNHVFRARIIDSDYEPRFVSAWGNTYGKDWFEVYGTQTTGIASINKATLSRFPIPAIDLTEQMEWVNKLDDIVSAHDALDDELAHLQVFRSTLLTAVVNQDIEIPDIYDSLLEVP